MYESWEGICPSLDVSLESGSERQGGWVLAVSPRAGSQGAASQGNAVRHLLHLERARNSDKTLSAYSTQWTLIHSVLGSKHNNACRPALRYVFSTAWLSKGTCFENTLPASPRMRPFLSHFPFLIHITASKVIGSAVKVSSQILMLVPQISNSDFLPLRSPS